MASNFSKNLFKPQAKRLTFALQSDAAECKIYEITGETVIYSLFIFKHFKQARSALARNHMQGCWRPLRS
jgi:hypothetical protein